jgi:uncharacterized coiled-coil DUF342 family protein
MTLHPRTQTEAQLMLERDAAIARAEVAEQELVFARDQFDSERRALTTEIGRLASELDVATNNTLETGKLAARYRKERDTIRTLLESSELRVMRMERELARVSDEARDTAIVAESIIAAPSTPDAKVEAALVEAIALARRAVVQSGVLSRAETARLRELEELVPS